MHALKQIWKHFYLSSTYRHSIVIFAITLLIRICLITALHPYRDLTRFELERTALSLATTGVYGNPYAVPTGPTAHVSPGYTVLLAGIFHLFGTGVPAEILKELLSSLITAAGAALIPYAAGALGIGAQTGLIAGLALALLPVKPMVQIDGDWEAPYTALFITLITIVVARCWRTRNVSLRSATLRGLLWGVALLFSSVLLPVLPVAILAGAIFFRHGLLRRYWVASGLEILIALLCLSPWILRNKVALGAPVSTRSNFGIELRVSNNDYATADQRVNYDLGVYDRYHPLQNAKEALRVRELGEVAYNKLVLDDTKTWIAGHTQRFVALTWGRFIDFWFYPDPSKPKALFGYLTAVLGFVGWYFLWTERREAAVLVGCFLLCYPAPSYLIHVGARQRYPIDWLLLLLTVYALRRLLLRLSPRPQR